MKAAPFSYHNRQPMSPTAIVGALLARGDDSADARGDDPAGLAACGGGPANGKV